MTAFGAGKVILFGEHTVVHGEPALAAALDVGISVTACDRDATAVLYDVPQWGSATACGDGTRQGKALERLVEAIVAEAVIDVAPLRMTLEVGIPVSAGLGSSAALAVALARALVAASGVRLTASQRARVVLAAAAASETVFHGSPSGLDHTTSVLGGIVRTRADEGAEPRFVPVTGVPPLSLVIAQMEPGADTSKMVASVASMHEREPVLTAKLISFLGAVTEEAIKLLPSGNWHRLGELMNLAHGGLTSLGVSTAALDAGCHAARLAGALGAKLTGAGGGGCLIALPAPGQTQAIVRALHNIADGEVIVTDISSSSAP